MVGHRVLELPPEPISAVKARQLIRELVRECGREEWLEAAELAVTELVTNGILHAHTQLRVSATCDDELRVEIADDSPVMPTQRERGVEATTGRGMGLVAALTQEHGSTATPNGGKVVWFVIRGTAEDRELSLGEWDQVIADLAAPDPEESRTCVQLLNLPSTLWIAASQRHDALLRELALLPAAQGRSNADVAAAERARVAFQRAVDAALQEARAAGRARNPLSDNHPARLAEVPISVDVDLWVDADDAGAFAALQDVLDEAERLATAGATLARPGLPEIVAVRDWACEQAIAQLSGLAAAPWQGTDAERFTALHPGEPWTVDWDTLQVANSTRGVVAADDGNRIIAISRPLADALGWDPQELVGRRVVAIVPPRFREAHVAGFTRHLTTGEAHALNVDLDLPVLRKDETEVLCAFFIEAHRTPSGRTVYVSWVTPKSEQPPSGH